jgi:serine phosphatase RsbU (regulator of sigma subunit)
LLRKYEDTPETGTLLETLNNALTLRKPKSAWDLRLTTVVTAVFDSVTGLLNFADAAHPRMLLRRAAEAEFYEIGRDLVNFPLGYSAGERYLEGSIQLNGGDIVLAFSDGASEVESPAGVELTADGFAKLASETLLKFKEPISLYNFSEALLHGVYQFHGGGCPRRRHHVTNAAAFRRPR